MVRLEILSVREPGKLIELDELPCTVGRAADATVRLEEPGIWERHLQIELTGDHTFVLKVLPQARATLNSVPVAEAQLKSGDLIAAGSVKMRFWLSPTRQRTSQWREHATWAGLILLCAGQIALVYLLLREP